MLTIIIMSFFKYNFFTLRPRSIYNIIIQTVCIHTRTHLLSPHTPRSQTSALFICEPLTTHKVLGAVLHTCMRTGGIEEKKNHIFFDREQDERTLYTIYHSHREQRGAGRKKIGTHRPIRICALFIVIFFFVFPHKRP